MNPARRELVALLTTTRPDWTPDETEGALLAAGHAGWTWPRTMTEAVRLACDPESFPRDLRIAADLVGPRLVPPPQVAAEGAARAWEALAAVQARQADEPDGDAA